MAQVLYQPDFYSVEEYLALEEEAEFRNEYHDGEIFSMAGGTFNHNQLAGNFYAAFLNFSLEKPDYRVAIGDIKLWIPKIRRFLYPDVMITADSPIYYQKRKDTITNPLVIVEVLSKSTRDYDRADKFKYYRSLPRFQEYLLINPWEFYVEQYMKTPTLQWLFSEYEGPEATLELKSIPFQIPLKTLYKKVDFEEES